MQKEGYGKLCKERMVGDLLSRLKSHPNFFIINYMGSSVADLEVIRRNLRNSSSAYIVVKNSMLNVALDELKLSDAKTLVDGGVGISLSGDDVIATCKVLADFARGHEKFKIKGGIIDGKLIDADKVKALSVLPPREVLLSQVVGGIKAPITGFVMVLAGVLRKFVYVVEAVRVNKERTVEGAPKEGSA